jgi:signal transduction histidine kinase
MAGYLLWSFYGYFMKMRQTDLNNWTTALSENVADALEENNLERAKLIVQRYGAAEGITLRVFAADGRLLCTSAPEIDGQVSDWLKVPGMKEAFQNKPVQGVAKGVLTQDERLYAAQPISRHGRILGVLRMSITLEQFQRQFRTVIFTVIGTLLLTLLLCALISEWLARNIARPIQAMSNFAIAVGSGNLGKKLNIRQKDELGQLAKELNRMSERLVALDQERRAFLANVSHELRTPVSNVLVTTQALRNGAAEEPELRDRFLGIVEDETKRLSRLIHDLLDLGRLEAGITAIEKQPLNLRSLMNQAIRAMESRMQAKGVVIRKNIPDVMLQGDPERLLQAFMNVLDNAIKHSQENSDVYVGGKIEGMQIAVQIRDTGSGISEQDLPHIFEQFYTTDRSRSGSGTGLGLAIARRIVEAHGGSITASSTPGQGAMFTICLAR